MLENNKSLNKEKYPYHITYLIPEDGYLAIINHIYDWLLSVKIDCLIKEGLIKLEGDSRYVSFKF